MMRFKAQMITIIVFVTIMSGVTLNAQVGINEDGSAPVSSAVLDLKSTSKGFLPPRMSETERDGISNPQPGLIVYCIDCVEMQMYNGTMWTNMIGGTATFPTITIGDQTWMAKNLNIGAMITGVTSMLDNNILEKYCYDDLESNCEVYGALYQWDEMMKYVNTESTQGICPTGFHLPSDEEWKTLEMQLGMSQVQADGEGYRGTDQASKMAGNELLWTNGPLDQDSSFGNSGFEALPGGLRGTAGPYYSEFEKSIYWSTTESGSEAWARYLYNIETRVFRVSWNKSYGYSVRCLQD